MVDLKWQDPPPQQGRKTAFTEEIRDALRERPGQWALVYTAKSRQVGTNWARRWGAQGFEIKGRAVASGSDSVDIYARYVGADQ